MIENTISVVDSHELLSLFGPRDQHLRKIRDALAVEISAHEHQVRIVGEKQAVARATEVLEQLKAYADRHGTPTLEDVERALSAVQGNGGDTQVATIDVFNANRKVKPRTPGQVRYVNAIRDHELVLAIGPAGTGKTYLAVAMAIAAVLLLVGYHFIILAMREGEVSFVSPFRYSSLLWAIGLSTLIFGEAPDIYTIIGSVLVVGSGVYMVYRENVLKKRERNKSTLATIPTGVEPS